ncbi:MAG: HAMP domain-containing histidine kinase [Saccharospirillaceae bacterium]|nr:HAMP domain-containing histidine kinase [Saccharospirillaceae bacterium]MCD8532935.1 HAMP domain-containing histidine kinase [Saccharospirillaceae bacterium]
MVFDIRTLVALMAITTLVCAVALFLFWRLLPEERGLRPAAFGAASQSLATCLMALRGQIDDVLSVFASNVLLILSYALLYQAMRIFCGQPPRWQLPGALILILAPVFLVFPGNEYLGLRIIASATGIGLLCFMISFTLYQARQQHLPARRGVAIAFAIAGLINSVRVAAIWRNPPVNTGFFDRSDDSIVFIWGIILTFIYAFSIIVMTSEQLRESLKQKLQDEQEAHKIADHALHEQRAFVTMLSHEFRTPLAIIRANTDAISLMPDHQIPEVNTAMERIGRANLRLTTLVNGCLNNDRIQNLMDNRKSFYAAVDLLSILQEVTDDYGIKSCRNNPNPVLVDGDRDLLFILFSNLINNAIKHASTRTGIELTWHTDAQNIHVEIADDGPGIPHEYHEKIFEKYFRINADKRTPGTGLGLYFVRSIAEQHKGKARLISGEKTRFSITLPLKETA